MTIIDESVDKKYTIFVTIGPKEDPLEKYDPDTFKKMFYDEVLTKTLLRCKNETYALKVKDYTVEGIWGPIWCLRMELIECKNLVVKLQFIRLVKNFKRKYGS